MNHIEEAKKFFNSINPEDEAKVHALIAIAEQLRIANLIALATSDLKLDGVAIETLEDMDHTIMGSFEMGSLKPDIAEALGIKEES